MDSLRDSAEEAARHGALVDELFGEKSKLPRPKEVHLPFRVRAVRTADDLRKALQLRAACYQRHFGTQAAVADAPEPEDLDPGSTLFLAELKSTGEAVGCLRFMTNRYNNLNIQKHAYLPEKFQSRHLADIRRLSVTKGSHGRLVKFALFKAVYLYAVALQIRYLVIGARAPLIRDYEGFYFQDVMADGLEVELLGKPHRILYLDIIRVPLDWELNKIRWFNAIFHDFHSDIEMFSPLRPAWVSGRAGETSRILASDAHQYRAPTHTVHHERPS